MVRECNHSNQSLCLDHLHINQFPEQRPVRVWRYWLNHLYQGDATAVNVDLGSDCWRLTRLTCCLRSCGRRRSFNQEWVGGRERATVCVGEGEFTRNLLLIKEMCFYFLHNNHCRAPNTVKTELTELALLTAATCNKSATSTFSSKHKIRFLLMVNTWITCQHVLSLIQTFQIMLTCWNVLTRLQTRLCWSTLVKAEVSWSVIDLLPDLRLSYTLQSMCVVVEEGL